MRYLDWDGTSVRFLDQTHLPARETWRLVSTPKALAEAISSMRVRGAPALGIAGAMGVALGAMRSRARTAEAALEDARRAGDLLRATRPTAVNLGWAIDRALRAGKPFARPGSTREDLVKALVAEADAIAREDELACEAIASAGQEFIIGAGRVMTHCNTGALVTGGIGTALGVIRLAHESGKRIRVLATETRPLLQGARLTAWELGRLGIAHDLIPDSAGPALLSRGEVDVVIVGADRIAMNGDTANKIGTYSLALAAFAANVPFVVAAPTTTIDRELTDGSGIEIEDRPGSDVTSVLGKQTAPSGTTAVNPAFDVTPGALISAIVTERGIARAPYTHNLAQLLAERTL